MAHGPWPYRTTMQIALIGSCLGSQIVTVHNWQVGTAREATLISDDLAVDACEELVNDWATSMQAQFVSTKGPEYTLTLLRGQVVERPGQVNHRLTPVEITPSGSVTGGATGSTEDLDTCGVIRWRTNRAGKSYRGRSYIGPLVKEWYADGRLTTTGSNALHTYGLAMKNRWAVGGTDHNDFALTVYSRPYDQGDYGYVRGSGSAREMYFPPDYVGNVTNVLAYAIDPILRTQRRRQIGVGS